VSGYIEIFSSMHTPVFWWYDVHVLMVSINCSLSFSPDQTLLTVMMMKTMKGKSGCSLSLRRKVSFILLFVIPVGHQRVYSHLTSKDSIFPPAASVKALANTLLCMQHICEANVIYFLWGKSFIDTHCTDKLAILG